MDTKIKAFKDVEGKTYRVACDYDDTEANFFTIRYYVYGCGFSTELDFTSKYKAEQVLSAMRSTYKSGHIAAFGELRRLIGAEAG